MMMKVLLVLYLVLTCSSLVEAANITVNAGDKLQARLNAARPGDVKAVPRQTYSGHEPCPLPVPDDLAYQWDDTYQANEDSSQERKVIAQASELLSSDDFPNRILNRRKLRLATWMHARGWRDYRYAIEAAQTYHLYAKKCGGEFTFSARS